MSLLAILHATVVEVSNNIPRTCLFRISSISSQKPGRGHVQSDCKLSIIKNNEYVSLISASKCEGN